MIVPPYAELARAWKSLRSRGIPVRELGCVGARRTLLGVDIVNALESPYVALAAGVHGDEPAAPWALLSLVESNLLDARFNYRIWPCINPTGYDAGTRTSAEGADINRSFARAGSTPEARAILTANRDRTFALTIDLHEDYESEGFYLYEPVMRASAPYGETILAAVDDAGLAVQDLVDGFDLGYETESHLREISRGWVRPDTKAEMAHFRDWPYSLALLHRGTLRSLTFETPRVRPWDERIAMHRVAVVAALGRLATLPEHAVSRNAAR